MKKTQQMEERKLVWKWMNTRIIFSSDFEDGITHLVICFLNIFHRVVF